MIKYFARASSLERRFLIGAALFVFLIFNWMLIWPRFGDWKQVQFRGEKARDLLAKFQKKVAASPAVEDDVKKRTRAGGDVPAEDQASDFVNAIIRQAAASQLSIQSNTRMSPRTNQFFVELAQALTFQTTDPPLVDFLYNLSAGNSLVRVRGFSLQPGDPSRQTLRVSVTLVGSYQKKVTPRAVAPVAAPAAAATVLSPGITNQPPPAAKPPSDSKSAVPPVPGVPKPATPPKK
ncbi:MAG: hypothetical protein EXS35_08880 [Pedosphaera sp.]|nr:hypothetical protein [Pedosphaera sp.]